jgi:hypothetical protein
MIRDLPIPASPDSNTACRFACCGALEPVDQQRNLVLASDKAREPPSAGIEAALDRPFRQHLPDPYRVGDAFQLLRPQIVEDKSSTDKLLSQTADHNLIRPCQRFQPCGEVGRLTGHGPCLASPGTVDIADNDGAGSDPDMHVK